MSWMDSWSRPSANSKVPAPLYLSSEDVPYCHTCGRVMSTKRNSKKQNSEVKYCSDRCRSRKPGARDKQIERRIVALLDGEPDSGIEETAARSRVVKGDRRLIVTCDEIEEAVFGSRFDPEKVYGRRKNRRTRAIGDPNAEWKSVDMESTDEAASAEEHEEEEERDAGPAVDREASIGDSFNIHHVRPPQEQSEINFSAGGGERSRAEKIAESAGDLEKRRLGAKRAEEREMVRRAARRAIVFGVEVAADDVTAAERARAKGKSKRGGADLDGETAVPKTALRKAEALMSGVVVEPSFAKGNWSIRWRE